MSPFVRDWLFQWRFWPQIILSLAGLAFIYGLGWQRLRQKGAYRLANGWRLASFLGGLAALWLAMISFIEVLQEFLFSVHMVQHLLIAMIAPPLLMLADPLPFLLWGLPPNARRAAGSAGLQFSLATIPQAPERALAGVGAVYLFPVDVAHARRL
jgi:cytochrome c oxidase assembly factor CtaG